MSKSVRVFYKCADCKLQRQGSPGMMFCPECGGELHQIGFTGPVSVLSDPRRRRSPRG